MTRENEPESNSNVEVKKQRLRNAGEALGSLALAGFIDTIVWLGRDQLTTAETAFGLTMGTATGVAAYALLRYTRN